MLLEFRTAVPLAGCWVTVTVSGLPSGSVSLASTLMVTGWFFRVQALSSRVSGARLAAVTVILTVAVSHRPPSGRSQAV